MSVVGFDFGTTNSLISVIQGGRAIHFLDEEQRPIPSLICYEGAQKILGREAKERLSQAGLGIQGNVIRSPKRYLGEESVAVEGIEKSPVEIVADVVRYVYQQAQGGSRNLNEISGVVVTIPIDMKGYQRSALRDAFKLAGLRIVQFVHEPFAALYGFFRGHDLPAMLRRYNNKLILVFDWGGGTLDLTLCRLVDGTMVQLRNDGTDEVGGDFFDESIKNHIVRNIRNSRKYDESVGTQQGAEARLIDRCERAKRDLSSRPRVQMYVNNFFKGMAENDIDYELSQRGLEEIVSPLLNKGLKRIEHILKSADYSPEQIALCIATGGMSNMPAVRSRLHEWFGPERVRIPDDTATLIAEGAARIASDRAELELSKNVELVLARNSYLPLVKAKTLMPKEGEVQVEKLNLYCTDPRDGVAKFEFVTPKRTGPAVLSSTPRTHMGTMTVKVDEKARAFHERLQLDIQINDDLVLNAHARALNKQDEDHCEIHNLEFGVRFPGDTQVTPPDDSSDTAYDVGGDPEEQPDGLFAELGAISVRSNIADCKKDSLVPGEFLYTYNPSYFDKRHNPPRQQVDEKIYYDPCSVCGRASNDPACRCSANLPP